MKLLLSLVAATALLAGGNALAIDAAKVTQALADPARSDADKALDGSRKPVEVLDYLGLEEGMTVLDIMSGGGWYTEILAPYLRGRGRAPLARLARSTCRTPKPLWAVVPLRRLLMPVWLY